MSNEGLKAERTALDTSAQNSRSERARRILVTKAYTIRIKANLPTEI